ncbi:maleylpyruvate isomerase N-terminal domain-containing protein [Streptosporangium sp. G11]|uniref:maleylpyruvate isomerase N-terminal domain-containing protein n=1 Tax=Streptosporangium sp. G11 TaxID=3436926 RepID=UPI003EC1381D
MTMSYVLTAPTEGIGLLKQALDYALATGQHITADLLNAPTPCDQWNLATLLLHLNESLDTLQEGLAAGCVGVVPSGPPAPDTDLLFGFRSRACRLLHTCAIACAPDQVRVADWQLSLSTLAGIGAIEIAVHGWDVGRACGHPYPIPANLAEDLLLLAPLVINDATRHSLFALPVPTSSTVPSDRLVALLGRDTEGSL